MPLLPLLVAAAPPSRLAPWMVLAAALAFVLAAAALWLRRTVAGRLRRLHRRVRRTGPVHPVVLAHGLFGFDEIRVVGGRHEYFRGVSARLEREGIVVHRARVAKAGSVASRAAELAAFVRTLPGGRVNLVAHSMGGLDARYAVARLGLANRVASVVTVGTPHLGTPLADVGAGIPGRMLLLAALARLGFDLEGFQDLTTPRMTAFNRAVPDARGVVYGSVVGFAPRRSEVNPLLLPTYLWLGDRAGASDGIVPAKSQRWGDVVATIEADHWAQIGWSRHFDAVGFYVDLLRDLRGRGL